MYCAAPNILSLFKVFKRGAIIVLIQAGHVGFAGEGQCPGCGALGDNGHIVEEQQLGPEMVAEHTRLAVLLPLLVGEYLACKLLLEPPWHRVEALLLREVETEDV